MAVSWIETSSDDELAGYLPQLVQVELKYRTTHFEVQGTSASDPQPFFLFSLLQALKFECHLNNALVVFLLSRAQSNINIAHYLFW